MCHYSLQVLAVLDHFGFPVPHLDQWQQRIWYDLGATQESLHLMCNCLAQGLPAVASPPRSEPSPSPRSELLHRFAQVMGENSLRLQKVEAPPSCTTTTGHSLFTTIASPKMEIKEKKKRKIAKRTVTSETISPPEKKRKLISESPDSEVEGPFRDSDRTESAPEYSSPAP